MKKEYTFGTIELHGSVRGEGTNLSLYDVKVRPQPEDKSNNPRYNCPVCLALGLRHRVIRTNKRQNCPICGVQLEWESKNGY